MFFFNDHSTNIFQNKLPYRKEKTEYTIKYDKFRFKQYFLDVYVDKNIRQYYHIPPLNDIGKYKRFIFPNLSSCKYNNNLCEKYSDLRFR